MDKKRASTTDHSPNKRSKICGNNTDSYVFAAFAVHPDDPEKVRLIGKNKGMSWVVPESRIVTNCAKDTKRSKMCGNSTDSYVFAAFAVHPDDPEKVRLIGKNKGMSWVVPESRIATNCAKDTENSDNAAVHATEIHNFREQIQALRSTIAQKKVDFDRCNKTLLRKKDKLKKTKAKKNTHEKKISKLKADHKVKVALIRAQKKAGEKTAATMRGQLTKQISELDKSENALSRCQILLRIQIHELQGSVISLQDELIQSKNHNKINETKHCKDLTKARSDFLRDLTKARTDLTSTINQHTAELRDKEEKHNIDLTKARTDLSSATNQYELELRDRTSMFNKDLVQARTDLTSATNQYNVEAREKETKFNIDLAKARIDLTSSTNQYNVQLRRNQNMARIVAKCDSNLGKARKDLKATKDRFEVDLARINTEHKNQCKRQNTTIDAVSKANYDLLQRLKVYQQQQRRLRRISIINRRQVRLWGTTRLSNIVQNTMDTTRQKPVPHNKVKNVGKYGPKFLQTGNQETKAVFNAETFYTETGLSSGLVLNQPAIKIGKRHIEGKSIDTPTGSTNNFDERFEELMAYKAKFGHCQIFADKNAEFGLRAWCKECRLAYKAMDKGVKSSSFPLSQTNIERLEDLSFNWGITYTFEDRFQELVEFKVRYGHCNVPNKLEDPHYRGLHTWCKNIQKSFKIKNANPLKKPPIAVSEEDYRRLQNEGFNFKCRQTRVSPSTRFEELLEFKAIFGHVNVTTAVDSADLELGAYCVRLRMHHRSLQKEEPTPTWFTSDLIKDLDNLNFLWKLAPTVVEFMEELREFKNVFGHCSVSPSNMSANSSLGNWCSRLRSNYTKFENGQQVVKWFTTGLIQELNDMGFQWKS